MVGPVGGDLGPDGGDAEVRSRRPVLGLLALVALSASFILGALVGWSASDSLRARTAASPGAEPGAPPEVVELRVPSTLADGALPMPDVRGLDRETALAILADTVLRGEEPTVLPAPWAGQPGIVIDQYPAFGARDPVGVRITVSEPAVVPAVVGSSVSDAVSSLQLLGAQVEVVRRFDPGQPLDVVLSVEPAPGSPLPESVRLIASERRGTLLLSGVQQVAGPTCSLDSTALGGGQVPEAVRCPIGLSDREFSWNLEGAASSVEGLLGLPDSAPSDSVLRFEISADGEPLTSGNVAYGNRLAIDVPTPDGLVLTIRARVESPSRRVFLTTTMVLSEFQLVGGSETLATLRADRR